MNVQWCWAATLWNGCPTSGNCVRWALPFFFCLHFQISNRIPISWWVFCKLISIFLFLSTFTFYEEIAIFSSVFFRQKRHSQKRLPFHSRSLCNCFSWCVAQICRFSARLLFLTTLGEIYLYSGRTHTAKWFGGNAVFWVIDSKAISFVGNKLVRGWNLILKKCNRVFSFFGWPVLFGHYMKMWIWSKTLNRNHCV